MTPSEIVRYVTAINATEIVQQFSLHCSIMDSEKGRIRKSGAELLAIEQ